MAYIYNADIFCDVCGEDICRAIQVSGLAPENVDDDQEFDSDEYPKSVDADGEADFPQHCGSNSDCLDPVVLSDGSKVGNLIGTNLTDVGIEYVRSVIASGGLVSEVWAEEFSDCL